MGRSKRRGHLVERRDRFRPGARRQRRRREAGPVVQVQQYGGGVRRGAVGCQQPGRELRRGRVRRRAEPARAAASSNLSHDRTTRSATCPTGWFRRSWAAARETFRSSPRWLRGPPPKSPPAGASFSVGPTRETARRSDLRTSSATAHRPSVQAATSTHPGRPRRSWSSGSACGGAPSTPATGPGRSTPAIPARRGAPSCAGPAAATRAPSSPSRTTATATTGQPPGATTGTRELALVARARAVVRMRERWHTVPTVRGVRGHRRGAGNVAGRSWVGAGDAGDWPDRAARRHPGTRRAQAPGQVTRDGRTRDRRGDGDGTVRQDDHPRDG